jgi:hypothetical protein
MLPLPPTSPNGQAEEGTEGAKPADASRMPEVLSGDVRGRDEGAVDHAEWQVLIDMITDGVCLLDTEGPVAGYNRAVAGLLFLPPGVVKRPRQPVLR